jgi:hypothetical protein
MIAFVGINKPKGQRKLAMGRGNNPASKQKPETTPSRE